MIQMLASVTNTSEALMAWAGGVDIIDLKNPAEGALGALPLSIIIEIVAAIDNRRVTSATIGNVPMEPDSLVNAIEKTAATGVDLIKIGLFPGSDQRSCIEAVEPITARGVHIVAVLFADQSPDFELLPLLQNSGFYGVMLDTFRKDMDLIQHIPVDRLKQFVGLAKRHKLKSGLAGSLRSKHLADTAVANPDYLGFRGALCNNYQRKSALDNNKLLKLRKLLRESNIRQSNNA
jgi:uncharacterized protein (UPF0264 family)